MNKENALVYVPEDNVTVSFEVTEEKPFNKCFKCRSFRNGCSGPNLFAMGIGRACEFLQLARIFWGYSYQYVADKTDLSLATVKRILTGKITDPNYFSMKALSDLLVSDPNGKAPCSAPDIVSDDDNANKLNDALRELERALNDNQDYRAALDNIHDSYKAEMQTIRAEAKEKIDYLRVQVDRLREQNDNLWAENNRKAKLVDMFWESRKITITENKDENEK